MLMQNYVKTTSVVTEQPIIAFDVLAASLYLLI